LEKELADIPESVPLLSLGKAALAVSRGTTWLAKMVGEPYRCVVGQRERAALSTWHPTFVYYHMAPLKPIFSTFLERSLNPVLKDWGEIHIEPTWRALQILQEWVSQKNVCLSVDVENAPSRGVLMCIGLSDGYRSVSVPWDGYGATLHGKGHYVRGWRDYGEEGAQAARLVRTIIEQASRWNTLVAHNGAHDARELSKEFKFPVHIGFDTIWAHAVLAPQRLHNLEDAVLEQFPYQRWKRDFRADVDTKGEDTFIERSEEDLRTYNAKDAAATFWLGQRLKELLDSFHNGKELYENYEWQSSVAEGATKIGIKVSLEKCEEHSTKLEARRTAVAHKIRELVGSQTFNPRSNKQLKQLFIDRFKLPVLDEGESGEPSFHEQVMTAYMHDYGSTHPQAAFIAKLIMQYRQVDKLINTYLKGIVKLIDTKGYIHPIFNVFGAQTGRWSSFIHTLPKPTTDNEGNEVVGMRDVFVCEEEDEWFVAADYSALELRLIALASGDDPLLEAFAADKDVHAIQCEKLFGKIDDKVKFKQLRDLTKTANYKMSYSPLNQNKAVKSMRDTLRSTYPNITEETVEMVVNGFWKEHPQIVQWRKEQYRIDCKRDYSEAIHCGRRRYYYGEPEDTKIFNWYGQADGAEVIRRGMNNVLKCVDKETDNLLLQWHDDLTFKSTNPERLAAMLQREMTITLEHKGKTCKIPVEVKVGKSLGTMKKWSGQ
jgi:DNA polymerase I-like protein with 3'-5' exonuclease and polymerase domains